MGEPFSGRDWLESEEGFWGRARRHTRTARNISLAAVILVFLLLLSVYGPAVTFG